MGETTSQADRVKSGLWGIPGMNDATSQTPADRRGEQELQGRKPSCLMSLWDTSGTSLVIG